MILIFTLKDWKIFQLQIIYSISTKESWTWWRQRNIIWWYSDQICKASLEMQELIKLSIIYGMQNTKEKKFEDIFRKNIVNTVLKYVIATAIEVNKYNTKWSRRYYSQESALIKGQQKVYTILSLFLKSNSQVSYLIHTIPQ